MKLCIKFMFLLRNMETVFDASGWLIFYIMDWIPIFWSNIETTLSRNVSYPTLGWGMNNNISNNNNRVMRVSEPVWTSFGSGVRWQGSMDCIIWKF